MSEFKYESEEATVSINADSEDEAYEILCATVVYPDNFELNNGTPVKEEETEEEEE